MTVFYHGIDLHANNFFAFKTGIDVSTGEVKKNKGLSVVESVFRRLKTDLDARPIFHRSEESIKGHIYIIIDYFIEKFIEWKIKNNLKISTNVSTIIQQLKQIAIVEKNWMTMLLVMMYRIITLN